MSSQECNLCKGIIYCKSQEGNNYRLKIIPEIPWALVESGSVNDCPIRRDPENHQREINARRLPDLF